MQKEKVTLMCPKCGNTFPIEIDAGIAWKGWIAIIMVLVGGICMGYILHMGVSGCG